MRGYLHPDFSALERALTLYRRDGAPGGAAICVYHRGECVADVSIGTRNHRGAPFDGDTLSLSLSTTKGVTSTVAHVLADEGTLDYDAPVARYWPEFAQSNKGSITVRHVLSHQAGLFRVRDLVPDARHATDWEAMTSALARAEPVHPPGASFGYHAWTFGFLVGEIIERATGQRFADVLRERVAEPLGLDGLCIGVPEGHLDRCADFFWPDYVSPTRPEPIGRLAERLASIFRAPGVSSNGRDLVAAMFPRNVFSLDVNARAFRTASIPSLNGMFSARSLGRLFAVLAAGGSLDGVRLLGRETVAAATAPQSTGLGRVVPFPLGFRMGYFTPFTLGARIGPFALGVPSPSAFGHFGFGGSGAWADPEREMAIAVTTNHGVGTSTGDLRIVAAGTIAAWCAGRR